MFRKYALATIILLAALLLVAHLYRDAIARRVANSYLSGQDLTIADVSIDKIGTGHIRFSTISLERRDGTRIGIFDISLPYDTADKRVESIEIGAIEIVPGEGGSTPTTPAVLFQLLLDAPNTIPVTRLRVGRVQYVDKLALEDVAWAASASNQSLQLLFRGISVDATVLDDGITQTVSVRAGSEPGIDEFVVELTARRAANSIDLEGNFNTKMAFLLATMRMFGVAPPNIIELSGEISGPIMVSLSADDTGDIEVTAKPKLDTDLKAMYRTATADRLDVVAHELKSIRVQLNYPSIRWLTQITSGKLTVGDSRFKDVAVSIRDLACRNGVFCAVTASLSSEKLETGEWALEDVSATVPLTFNIAADTTVELSSGTEISGRLKSDNGVSIGQATLQFPKPLTITATADSWSAKADEVSLLLGDLAIGDSFLATLPFQFDSLVIGNSGKTTTANFAIPAESASWRIGGMLPAAIDISGTLQRAGEKFSADIGVFFSDGSALATLKAQHDLHEGVGSLSVSNSEQDFAGKPLSRLLADWPYEWDVVAGASTLSANLRWSTSDGDFGYEGDVKYSAIGLDGHYGDSAFVGLSTTVDVQLGDQNGVTVLPAAISVRLVEVGVAIEDVSAAVAADVQNQLIHFDNVSMSALGGQLTTDPFTLSIMEQATNIVLRLRSVQLQFIVNLADFESIQMTGSVSGILPIRINGNQIIVDGGRLESDEPGGSIRYIPPAGDMASTDDSQLGLVTRALSNFQFDSLVSDVSFSENGDLVLKMTLEGINPDLDATQPVILNLSVENNIPQLLRSLQATRSIEEILDRKAKK